MPNKRDTTIFQNFWVFTVIGLPDPGHISATMLYIWLNPPNLPNIYEFNYPVANNQCFQAKFSGG